MKAFLATTAILAFCACAQRSVPISSNISENNRTYKVDYLFEHDGCKVYRFADNGYYVYYTNCNGMAVARTDSTQVMNSTHLLDTASRR